jgi:Glycosyl hydrolase family 12
MLRSGGQARPWVARHARTLACCACLVLLSACTAAASRSDGDQTTGTVATHPCSHWNFASSNYSGHAPYGSGYIVENDVWNPVQINQNLYSCGFDSFYVEANVKNVGAAVQSYPSSQYTFASPVRLSRFKSLTSDFRVSDPPTGSGLDYEFAYDIWFNGYGGDAHTEMMIWTYNDGRKPLGTQLPGLVTMDGHLFSVWEYGIDGYVVTFKAVRNYTSGHTNLLPFFSYAASHGWLVHGTSTPLWQIDYGVELTGTSGFTKFDFTDFDVAFKT